MSAQASWPSRRLLDLVAVELPLVQAPMIGPKPALARAVSAAGGLGSIGAAAMSADQLRTEVAALRAVTDRPFNLNFFAHRPAAADPARAAAWQARLAPYYAELGLDPEAAATGPARAPFDADTAALVEALKPPVVSFHFGLPEPALLARVKQAGALVLSSATSAAEARWLEDHGADAVIAQGAEAGGHRGMFLETRILSQVGTVALVPQVADAVTVPVIAAGGIADGRGIAAAFALGADGVQMGTAFLRCPEAGLSAAYLAVLETMRDGDTALTNLFTGRPARGIMNRLMAEQGPVRDDLPGFPGAAPALAPLRTAAEAKGATDFTPLWAGQAGALARPLPAGELVRRLADEALARLKALAA